ncbi:hypothetical protein [Xanthomonas arboricola]|uniref:hypothetical protein n=1 Tax=Xanthomonas arboricola TaxID=56448 RepID=UPI0011AF3C36|nr:hypothetical protein [Xanthomonas arboricola]
MTCQLDICGNVNTIVTVTAAAFGWWLVHRLNSARDRVNSERTMRTTELSKVHSTLVRAGIDGSLNYKDSNGNTVWTNKELEDAIGQIYLYGTAEQIALAQKYVDSWSGTQSADGTELVDSLRNHIRDSLGLDQVNGPLKYLRVTVGGKGEA